MSEYEGSFEEAAQALARIVDGSVARSVEGCRRVAVAFSGGLDSSVVTACARKKAEVVACSAFAAGALDSKRVEAAARALGVELAATAVTKEDALKELMPMKIPFEPSPMDRSLWCLYSVVSRRAKEEGAKIILLGQLADELFGGYAKYVELARKNGPTAAMEAMKKDASEYRVRGRVRDFAACSRWVDPRFPYCSEEVALFAESLPIEYKIRGGVRKAVLRRAAAVLGVPDELALADKKAAQYSSGIQKLIA